MTQEHVVPEEERRLVTILFADLVGYTSLSEARDPELIMESLILCFDRLSAEIRRFGGYVDKVVGDEIMALFGAPRAQEDDAGKAVSAGLAMQRALEELTPQLQHRLGEGFRMRVGINTGLVVTGAIGPGGYTVTGDAVNVAARLEKAGEPGTITVGEATRRLARRQFQWAERRGDQPLDRVADHRQEHLHQIRALWDAAGTGSARVLQLVGEAGIGKTRLLAHLFAEAGATPEQVLYTRADTPPRTFGPLMQLLPSLRDSLPAGVADVIRTLAGRAPVAVVLDDMHRADRATIEIVEKVLPRLQSLPVLTLLLRQPTGRRVRHLSEADTITLQPLSPDQGRALVNSVGAGPRRPISPENLFPTP